ncbi:MAG: alanine racemase [Deltaproteobacteria bacterium]|nr:MAG: alanine racemase [Deltaproteobacteria bacterium]
MSDPAIDPSVLSWCEVSTAALAANTREMRRRVGDDVLLGIVVKSDAYGHGLVGASRAFVDAGADWLVVNALHEAQTLRTAGLTVPIYVAGHVPGAAAAAVVRADARVVVYDADVVDALAAAGREAGRPVPVHLKIETGNQRQGLLLEDALALGRRVAATDGVVLEGLATHYADIEDTTDHRFAMQQLARFDEAAAAFAAAGLPIAIRHTANSAATILWGRTHGELVRVGLSAYGMWPSAETHAVAVALAHREQGGRGGFMPTLTPALTWRARLAQVKEVAVGEWIGYGRTFRATHPMRIGIVPVGYFEGYDRRLSNLAHALVDGVRAPVRGRVAMNMTVLDVTHIPSARAGSIATLLGADGDERVSAEDLAGWMGTINYEVVARIHPSLPRRFV